ncbi:MAG: MFS transporter [Blautia sp.]|nr:MFS transporter [Blautia sp.]
MANETQQSQTDGVQYRRAKMWQILCYACNSLVGMSVYSLIGLASYSANLGFGIATLAVGGILTFTRVFDAITDPLLAFIYDKVNTRFGKIRVLMAAGWLVEALGLLGMYVIFPGKGLGAAGFILLYMVYVIGYTMTNMTAQTIPALMTNDPKQRPTVGVWVTAFNYLVPIVLTVVLTMVLLPMYGGEYNLKFLSMACLLCLAISLVGTILVCLGVAEYDSPENFEGIGKREPLKLKDMLSVLKDNKPLQCYIVSAASDKIAQQASTQAVVTTMLFGIVIGNMQLSTILNMVAMLPSILFAVFGARYAGRHGNKESIVTWTYVSMTVAALTVLFFIFVPDTRAISTTLPLMAGYVILTLALNGAKMCVTTANTAFMSDLIDYELDRSGQYIPAVVTGTYSLIDKLVSSVSAAIATGAIALIGYTSTLPQPTDELSSGIFWMTMILTYGLALIGWVCTLCAMRNCTLTKDEMARVQKQIADKKAAAVVELARQNGVEA